MNKKPKNNYESLPKGNSQTNPLRKIAVLAATLVVAACATPNRQYQPAGQAKIDPLKRYTDNSVYKDLCAIEFDEQGDLWSNEQFQAAKAMIKKGNREPLLVVFVHGWQHNARSDNENLQSFNHLLKEAAKHLDTDFLEVKGVYIGWRGLAIEREWDKIGIGWLGRQLSFYSRKNDTDLVASIPLTNTLYRLAAEAHSRGGRVIFIGHSFGARILEKALAQAIVGQTASGSKEAILPADLTLLLNPASEAITARRLKLALADWSQPTPAIISVTSLGDTDTSFWWSLGMGTATATKIRSYRDYQDGTSQREYVVKTAGHSPILRDREIVKLELSPATTSDQPARWNSEFATINQFIAAKQWWRIREISTSSAPFVMNENHAKGYWVISVPKEIIASHNDIFNDSTIELCAALFNICRPSIQKSPEEKAITVPSMIAQSGMN